MAKKYNKKIVYRIINSYLTILRKNKIYPRKVYIFGSFVKNKFTENSDIDLAIVSNRFKGDIIEDNLMLMRLRRDIDLRIEPHAFTTKEFNVNNPFVREIIKTGKRII
jgi:predicted nucleotidyltransferase